MGVAAAAGVLHYVVAGPNKVTKEDEENAEKLTEGKGVPPPASGPGSADREGRAP